MFVLFGSGVPHHGWMVCPTPWFRAAVTARRKRLRGRERKGFYWHSTSAKICKSGLSKTGLLIYNNVWWLGCWARFCTIDGYKLDQYGEMMREPQKIDLTLYATSLHHFTIMLLTWLLTPYTVATVYKGQPQYCTQKYLLLQLGMCLILPFTNGHLSLLGTLLWQIGWPYYWQSAVAIMSLVYVGCIWTKST